MLLLLSSKVNADSTFGVKYFIIDRNIVLMPKVDRSAFGSRLASFSKRFRQDKGFDLILPQGRENTLISKSRTVFKKKIFNI